MNKQRPNWRTILKSSLILIGVAVLIVLLFPYESEVVPTWKAKVVNESGIPLKRVGVTEIWKNYSLESREHEERLLTDDDGYVTFPRRTIRASLLMRVVGPISNTLSLGVHASYGPSAFLIVDGDMNTFTAHGIYILGEPLPEQVVREPLR